MRIFPLCSAILLATPLLAQQPDTLRAKRVLPVVRVTATREAPRAPLELPYAITSVTPDSLAALRRLGIDELLFAVPGVALSNRQNPAQDQRVSIRGFGARSAFGVRGVRVLQDGVPITLPDGQTPVDALDIEGASRVDVVRGSASSLYGNAAGGVIEIHSPIPSLIPLAPYVRIVGGGDTPTIAAAGANGTLNALGYTSSVTRIAGEGYRDYSDVRATRGAVRLLLPASAANGFSLALAARISDMTHAESPGALTLAQFEADPRQADPLAVRKQAGKTVRQSDLSLSASHALGTDGSVDAVLFGSLRTLGNPLTYATVDVDRSSGGASLRFNDVHQLSAHEVRLGAGADVQWQRDGRLERENCVEATAATAKCPDGASLRGALRKDQRELVTSVGPYVRGEIALASNLLASAGVRADAVRFEVQDHLVSATNADDSGDRTLHAVSPAVGLVWRASALASVYGNVSSSFETPTTTELGNKPDGSPGINPELKPQRTITAEVGAKGVLAWVPVQWDVALFQARAQDELVPFDIVKGGGRRYFRNAGRTVRRGGELGLEGELGQLSLRSAYTYSHFRYVDYAVDGTSFAGNRIPAIPAHALALSAALREGPLTWFGMADMASAIFADDANAVRVDGRTILGAAVSGTLDVGGARLEPMVAVQNLTGVRTVGSVTVNATGGKYYEPAPGRTLLVRLAVTR